MTQDTIINVIRRAIANPQLCKKASWTPRRIEGYVLSYGDRWSGGHGTYYEGAHYNIINIRHKDGTPYRHVTSMVNYPDGELIADLIESGPAPEDPDNLNKLIALAYALGRTEAARAICDEHTRRVKKAREAADQLRYHNLGNAVLDAMGGDIIYTPDYAGDVIDFASDPTTFVLQESI
jgi:hypothetical protein